MFPVGASQGTVANTQAPREFHGTIRFGLLTIGGEGGDAFLSTRDGGYDLFFPRGFKDPWSLRILDGKRVIVRGHAR